LSINMNRYMQMAKGEIAPPPVFELLGGQVKSVAPEQGLLEVEYSADVRHTNPAGTIQGGILCAMLDDLTAGLVDSTVAEAQSIATLGLNTTFLRPGRVGAVSGKASFIRRGREICQVSATLEQNGSPIAMATAICKIVHSS
jgi:uncharacterized protein (TIGR00369 family)